MTIPDEEIKALEYAQEFLEDIVLCKYKPMSKKARTMALAIFRHYPVKANIRRNWKP